MDLDRGTPSLVYTAGSLLHPQASRGGGGGGGWAKGVPSCLCQCRCSHGSLLCLPTSVHCVLHTPRWQRPLLPAIRLLAIEGEVGAATDRSQGETTGVSYGGRGRGGGGLFCQRPFRYTLMSPVTAQLALMHVVKMSF